MSWNASACACGRCACAAVAADVASIVQETRCLVCRPSLLPSPRFGGLPVFRPLSVGDVGGTQRMSHGSMGKAGHPFLLGLERPFGQGSGRRYSLTASPSFPCSLADDHAAVRWHERCGGRLRHRQRPGQRHRHRSRPRGVFADERAQLFTDGQPSVSGGSTKMGQRCFCAGSSR